MFVITGTLIGSLRCLTIPVSHCWITMDKLLPFPMESSMIKEYAPMYVYGLTMRVYTMYTCI